MSGGFAGGHSCKPFSSDTNNGEGMPFDTNLFAQDVERAAETLLPELISEHCHLRGGSAAGIGIFRSQQSSNERSFTPSSE